MCGKISTHKQKFHTCIGQSICRDSQRASGPENHTHIRAHVFGNTHDHSTGQVQHPNLVVRSLPDTDLALALPHPSPSRSLISPTCVLPLPVAPRTDIDSPAAATHLPPQTLCLDLLAPLRLADSTGRSRSVDAATHSTVAHQIATRLPKPPRDQSARGAMFLVPPRIA